jgi:hypothetical protein
MGTSELGAIQGVIDLEIADEKRTKNRDFVKN